MHGTVGTISDPHEIANVCGVDGVKWMMNDAERVPLHVCFGAPSCVPATSFETAGAELDATHIAELLRDPRIGYLSEMMNFPGVLYGDAKVSSILEVARASGKPIDGHAPGVRGEAARAYAAAGITTDHECTTLEEALEKISYGMSILIREGSAAKNFDALHSLISSHPQHVMLCSDDKHPDALVQGHINVLVRRAMECGHSLFDVLRVACVNPVLHYGLPVGLLRIGDRADFIVMDSVESGSVKETFVHGVCVARDGAVLFAVDPPTPINTWFDRQLRSEDFYVPALSNTIRVIDVADGQLTTGELVLPAPVVDNALVSDTSRDVLKLVVVNRYANTPPAVAFVRNMGLRHGALASSVAHDSHNVIAVGVHDDDIVRAVNAVFEWKGGCVAVSGDERFLLPLPVGGLMSIDEPHRVAAAYEEVDAAAKRMGSTLQAPLMTLSFLALLVIPSLKLGDRGLFDIRDLTFRSLFVDTQELQSQPNHPLSA